MLLTTNLHRVLLPVFFLPHTSRIGAKERERRERGRWGREREMGEREGDGGERGR